MSKSDEMYAPVGSLVLSGYWGTVDLVLEHVAGPYGPGVKVVGVDHPEARNRHDDLVGRVRVHSTRLDRRDRIVGTADASVIASYLSL